MKDSPYTPPSVAGDASENLSSKEILIKFSFLSLLSFLVGYLSAKKLGFGVIPGYVMGLSIFGVGAFAIIKLGRTTRELWSIFALKLFSVTAYKILNSTLVLWMATDLGFKDGTTAAILTAWALTMSVSTLLVGSVTDAIGVRRTLLIGVSLCLLTRLVMISSTNPWLTLTFGLMPLALGEALCTPVLVAALRKVTSPAQRTVAFSLFYAIMNFGFMVSWFVFDSVKLQAMPGGMLEIGDWSPFRVLLLTSFSIEILLLPFIFFMKRDQQTLEEGGKPLTLGQTISHSAKSSFGLLGELCRQPGFGKLLAFLAFIGCLKVVFNVMDYVLPRFTLAELGEGVKVGRFNAINGILILVLAPVIGMLTRKVSAWSMVIFGGFITASSFVFMALPASLFQGWADGPVGKAIGHGYMEMQGAISPWYVMIVLWQVVFSIGEAFYSPRVYEYAAAIAPTGKEASYASLSYVPLLIGKILNGALFGFIFDVFYPKGGQGNPSGMWTLIGALVLVAPAGLLLLSRQIRVKEEGRVD